MAKKEKRLAPQDEFHIAQRENVWKERLEGKSIPQIAVANGLTNAKVEKYLQEAAGVFASRFEIEAKAICMQELARTEIILQWAIQTMKSNTTNSVSAGTLALKTLERRSKMLGLDKPEKVEVAQGTSLDELRERLEAAVREQYGDSVGEIRFSPDPLPEVIQYNYDPKYERVEEPKPQLTEAELVREQLQAEELERMKQSLLS